MNQTTPEDEQHRRQHHPIPTTALTEGETKLLERFQEDIARQSDHMDELAKRLITLELAIPGLYATALRLAANEQPPVPLGLLFWATIAYWLVALILAFMALIPRNYKVAPDMLEGEDPRSGAIGVKDYFNRSASYKLRLLIGSGSTFFLGILTAIINTT